MRHSKRTTLSLAAMQALVWAATPALAQNAPAPASAATPAASGAQALETVVVSGRRAALASAQKLKQESDEIVDSVVADEIGKLPDRSVSEVLQRIVGATMSPVGLQRPGALLGRRLGREHPRPHLRQLHAERP